MKSYHVYGIGNALLDIEFQVSFEELEDLGLSKGIMTLISEEQLMALLQKMNKINHRKVASGGSAANSMIALQQFGAKGFYTCKIANDEIGNHYYQDMKTAGLHSNMDIQTRQNGHTGRCLVFVTPDADRTMQTFLGISESLSKNELDEVSLKASEYLYIEGYLVTSVTAREAVDKAHGIAQAQGVKTSLSLSDPAIATYFKSQFENILSKGIDLLFCNQEEAMIYTGTSNISDAQEALQKVSKQFAMTLGANGSLLFDGNRLIEIAPNKVTAVDTVGAGDMYAGAMLYALSQGMSWEKAGELASHASAKVVSQYGPRLDQADTLQILDRVINIRRANCA